MTTPEYLAFFFFTGSMLVAVVLCNVHFVATRLHAVSRLIGFLSGFAVMLLCVTLIDLFKVAGHLNFALIILVGFFSGLGFRLMIHKLPRGRSQYDNSPEPVDPNNDTPQPRKRDDLR